MRLKLALTTTAAALMAALASPGHATVLPYKNLDALVNEADGIVIGTVRSVEAAATKAHDVHTYVTLDQLDVVSGKLKGQTLTLRVRGGLVDGKGLHVEGAPNFKPDERVMLFVQGNGRDLVPLVGWGQGMFRLVNDAASGKATVQDAEGNDVVGLAEGHVQRRAGEHMDVALLGAPESVKHGHLPKPEMSAGQADDGSVSTLVELRQAPQRAMSAERFVADMRQRAARHTGKTLRSVTPQDTLAQAEAASASDTASAAARQASKPVAMPEAGQVSLPAGRNTPSSTDQR